MSVRPRIRDVAERAGVSTATVSNVFNKPEVVLESTRERVMRAVDELRYVPNRAARQLRVGQSLTVGCVVLDMANPYFMELARGVEDRLRLDGYALMLCSSDEDGEQEAQLLAILAQNNVRGILVTPCSTTIDNLPYLQEHGIPVVLVGSSEDALTVSTVGVDDVAGGSLAVGHLLAEGHRRIGVINDTHRLPHCRARWDGAVEAVASLGLDPDEVLVEVPVPDRGTAGGEQAMSTLLDNDNPPTGVFCYNDVVALGAMRAVRVRGLSIPDDVAIVGFDDIPLARDFVVPLTSVRQPVRKVGWTAADLVLKGGSAPVHVRFEPELVVRESSR